MAAHLTPKLVDGDHVRRMLLPGLTALVSACSWKARMRMFKTFARRWGKRLAAQPAQLEHQQVACASEANCLDSGDIERRKSNALDGADVIPAPFGDDLPAMPRLFVGVLLLRPLVQRHDLTHAQSYFTLVDDHAAE